MTTKLKVTLTLNRRSYIRHSIEARERRAMHRDINLLHATVRHYHMLAVTTGSADDAKRLRMACAELEGALDTQEEMNIADLMAEMTGKETARC